MLVNNAERKAYQAYAKTPVPERAMACVVGSDVTPGLMTFLPTLGWVRDHGLHVFGFLTRKSTEEPSGALEWVIPTDSVAVVLLDALGWSGQIWPRDQGWPYGTPDKDQLEQLMGIHGLANTITFPPVGEHPVSMDLFVWHGQQPFPLNPNPANTTPPQDRLDLYLSLTPNLF